MSDLRPNQKNKYRAFWELAHGVAKVESTVPSLQIAKNNSCNFKCVYCIDHRPGNQIPRVRLEPEVWRSLMELIPRTSDLGFHGISEFFIDPEFFDVIRRAAEAGAGLSLNTNASVCTPRHLDALANYPGFIWITFSLDAATPETFSRIRGQDFWRILHNVKAYIDRFAQRRKTTWISVSFVINRSSVREMSPFLYLAKALGVDSVTYFRMHEYEGLDWESETKYGGPFNYRAECVGSFAEEYNRELDRVRKAAEVLGVSVELPAPVPTSELIENIPKSPAAPINRVAWIQGGVAPPLCHIPWMGTVAVLADGNVNFCCYSSAVVGNVNHQPFADIWSGPVMASIRQELSSQRFPRECQSLSCPLFRGDELTNLTSDIEPYGFRITKTLDPHAQLRDRLQGSRCYIVTCDGSLKFVLEICYRGAPLQADLFAAIRYRDGAIRFLPDFEEYAVPLLCTVELREEQSPQEFDLSVLPDSLFTSGACHMLVALFAAGSDPNRISNCYWSEMRSLVRDGERVSVV